MIKDLAYTGKRNEHYPSRIFRLERGSPKSRRGKLVYTTPQFKGQTIYSLVNTTNQFPGTTLVPISISHPYRVK